MHGAMPFDIYLPLTGSPGIECRNGGTNNDYQIVVTFVNAVTFSDADVTSGDGSVSSATGSGTTTATLNLTGVTSEQTIEITLSDADDGTTIGDLTIQMGVLPGDSNADRRVNVGDTNQTNSRSGQTTNGSNFRSDVNLDGRIGIDDVNFVQARSGAFIP
jgi:hypothetical protein